MDKTELLYNNYQQFNLYFRATRSTKQNTLYWKWLTILTETDHFIESLHQYLAQEHLGDSVEEIKGKTIFVIKSAIKLTTKDFSDYLTQVDAFALDEGDIFPYYDIMRINVRAFMELQTSVYRN